MKQRIKEILSDALPAINFDSDFLFGELDSLGVVTIMMILSDQFNVKLEATDITPKNFRSLDSLAQMVQSKME